MTPLARQGLLGAPGSRQAAPPLVFAIDLATMFETSNPRTANPRVSMKVGGDVLVTRSFRVGTPEREASTLVCTSS
jgi:hypothetical protein